MPPSPPAHAQRVRDADPQAIALGGNMYGNHNPESHRSGFTIQSHLFGAIYVIGQGSHVAGARFLLLFAAELLQLLYFPLSMMDASPALRPLATATGLFSAGFAKQLSAARAFVPVFAVVIAGILAFIILLTIASVHFARGWHQHHGIIRVLRLLTAASTSLLFIPVTAVMIHTLRCDSGAASAAGGGRWMGTQLECGGAGHYVLASVALLLLLLFVGLAMLLGATVVDANPTSSSWWARIHGRLDLAVLGLKLLLTAIWAMSDRLDGNADVATGLGLGIALSALGAAWVALVWRSSPFIHMPANALALAAAAVFTWYSLAAFVYHATKGSGLDPTLMVLLGTPFVGIAAYQMFMRRVSALQGRTRRAVEGSVPTLELWARLRLQVLLRDPAFQAFVTTRNTSSKGKRRRHACLSSQIRQWQGSLAGLEAGPRGGGHGGGGRQASVDGSSAASPSEPNKWTTGLSRTGDETATQTMGAGNGVAADADPEQLRMQAALTAVEEAAAAYTLLVDQHSSSEVALLTSAAFLEVYSPFQYGELLALHWANRFGASLDTRYRIFRRLRQLHQSNKERRSAASGSRVQALSGESLAVVDRVLVDQNVRKIRQLERHALSTNGKLWATLGASCVDLAPTVQLAQELEDTFTRLDLLYQGVLRVDPTSTTMLRGYAALLRSRHLSEEAGLEFANKADRIEEAHSRRKARAMRHVVYGAHHHGLLTGSDESLAVMVIAGEPSNLGELVEASMGACRLFHYRSSQQLIGANVTELIPEPIRSQHDRYLHRFSSRQTSEFIDGCRCTFAATSSGAIVPCWLQVSEAPPNPVTATPRFTGTFEQVVTTEQHLMVAPSDESFRIYAGTAGSLDLLGLSPESLKGADDDTALASSFFPMLSTTASDHVLVVTMDSLRLMSHDIWEMSGFAAPKSATGKRPAGAAANSNTFVSFSTKGEDAEARRHLLIAASLSFEAATRLGEDAMLLGTSTEIVRATPDEAIFLIEPMLQSGAANAERLLPVITQDEGKAGSADRTSLAVVVGGLQRARHDHANFLVLYWRSTMEVLRKSSHRLRARMVREMADQYRGDPVLRLPSAGLGEMPAQGISRTGSGLTDLDDTSDEGQGERAQRMDVEGATAAAGGTPGVLGLPSAGSASGARTLSQLAAAAGSGGIPRGSSRASGLPRSPSVRSGASAGYMHVASRTSLDRLPQGPPSASSLTGGRAGGRPQLPPDGELVGAGRASPSAPRAPRPSVGFSLMEPDHGSASDLRRSSRGRGSFLGDGQSSEGSSGSQKQTLLARVLRQQHSTKDRDIARLQLVLACVASLVLLIGATNLIWVSSTQAVLQGLADGLYASGDRIVTAQTGMSLTVSVMAVDAGLRSQILPPSATIRQRLWNEADRLRQVHEGISVSGDLYGSTSLGEERSVQRLFVQLAQAPTAERLREDLGEHSATVGNASSAVAGWDATSAPCQSQDQCPPDDVAIIGEAAQAFWLEAADLATFHRLDPSFDNATVPDPLAIHLYPSKDLRVLQRQSRFLQAAVPAVAQSLVMPLSQLGTAFSSLLVRLANSNSTFDSSNSDLLNVVANDEAFLSAANDTVRARSLELATLLPSLRSQLQLTSIICFIGILVLQSWLAGSLVKRIALHVRGVARLLLLVPRQACQQAGRIAELQLSRLVEDDIGSIEEDSDEEGLDDQDLAVGGGKQARDLSPNALHQSSSGDQHSVSSDDLERRLMEAGASAHQLSDGVRMPSARHFFDKNRQFAGGRHARSGGRRRGWSPSQLVPLRSHTDSSRTICLHNLRLTVSALPHLCWIIIIFVSQLQQQARLEALANQSVLVSMLAESSMTYKRLLMEAVLAHGPLDRSIARRAIERQGTRLQHLAEVGFFGGELQMQQTLVYVQPIDPGQAGFRLLVEDGCLGSMQPEACRAVDQGVLAEGTYQATMQLVALGWSLVGELPSAQADVGLPLVYGNQATAWHLYERVSRLVEPHLKESYARMSTALAGELRLSLDKRWQQALWATVVFSIVYIGVLITTLRWVDGLVRPLLATRAALARIPPHVQSKVAPLQQALRDMAQQANMEVVNVRFDPKTTAFANRPRDSSCRWCDCCCSRRVAARSKVAPARIASTPAATVRRSATATAASASAV